MRDMVDPIITYTVAPQGALWKNRVEQVINLHL